MLLYRKYLVFAEHEMRVIGESERSDQTEHINLLYLWVYS